MAQIKTIECKILERGYHFSSSRYRSQQLMDKLKGSKIALEVQVRLSDTQVRKNQTTYKREKSILKPMSGLIERSETRFSLPAILRLVSAAMASIALSCASLVIPMESSAQSIFSPTLLPEFIFGSRTLKLGLAGTDVVELQQRLQRFGYNVPVTGLFDESTEAGVIAFQFDRGLTADGEVGVNTVDALEMATSFGFNAGSILVLQRGDRGDRVLQLQQRLQSAGFAPGPLDGSFGIETEAAVIDFQLVNRLSPTGIVDAQTEVLLQQYFNPRLSQSFASGQLGQEWNVYAVVIPVRQRVYAPALLQGVRQLRPDAILVESADRGAYINAGSFNNCDRAESFAELLRDEGYEANVAYFANREFFAVDGQTPFSYNPYGLPQSYSYDRPLSVPFSPTLLPRF